MKEDGRGFDFQKTVGGVSFCRVEHEFVAASTNPLGENGTDAISRLRCFYGWFAFR